MEEVNEFMKFSFGEDINQVRFITRLFLFEYVVGLNYATLWVAAYVQLPSAGQL